MTTSGPADIHQVQMQYLADEDRLLLRLNTHDKVEIRLLITRRYLKILWPNLTKALADSPGMQQYDQNTRRAAAAFEHQNVMSSADVSKQFKEEQQQLAWGEEALLLTKVAVRKSKEGVTILNLAGSRGNGMDIAQGSQVLHYIYKLILDSIGHTDWDLRLQDLSAGIEQFDPSKLN